MEDFRIKISSQLDLKDAETKIKNFINTYNNKNINLNVELGKSFNANNIVKDISKVQRQVNQKIKGFKINNVNDDFVAGFIKNLQRQADEAEKVTKRFGKNLKKINETKYDRNAMAAIKAEERESKRIAKEQERENKRILEEKIKDINISNREREKLDKKNLSIRKKNAEAILREELSLIDKQKQIEAKIFKNENGGNKNLVYYYKNQRKQVEKELGLLKNELNKNYSDIYSKTEHDSILKNKSLESKGIVDLAKAKHKDDLKRKNNIIRQKEFKSYSNAYTDAYQSIGVKSNTLKKMAEYYENLEIESKKNYNKYKQIKSKISQGSLDVSTSSVRKKLDSFSGIDSQYLVKAESSYKKLLALQKELTTGKSLADGSKLSNEQMIARWNRFGSILKKVQNQTKVLGNEFGNIAKPFSKIDAEIASNKTLTWLNKNTKAVKEYGDKLKELAELQAKATSNRELNKYNKEFKKITSEAAAKGKTGLSLKDDFKRAFGQIFQFAGTYGMIQNVAFEIPRQIANEVKAIDSAKIELTKVSSASTGQLSAYWNEAAASAKKYGSTIDNVIKTTADWSRLGYGLEDAKKLSNATTLMQTIGDNMTQESASEGLISTLRGFQLRASEVDNIVDKINEVSNTQPIDTAGIFEGLKRSASSMSAANNTLEETIGLITAANSVVQDPAKVGTGFKTKFNRNCLYVQKCA